MKTALVTGGGTAGCAAAHQLDNKKFIPPCIKQRCVGRRDKYVCVESYWNESEKANLLYWQLTCESFYDTDEWKWEYERVGYSGDYGFIFFE
jgi:protein-L-isoaspartate(D-aspartate) O-methyltransferase